MMMVFGKTYKVAGINAYQYNYVREYVDHIEFEGYLLTKEYAYFLSIF